MVTMHQAPTDLDANVILPGGATDDAVAGDVDLGEANSQGAWVRIALVTGLPFAALIAIYISRLHLPWLVLSAYGLVSIGRVFVRTPRIARPTTTQKISPTGRNAPLLRRPPPMSNTDAPRPSMSSTVIGT